MWWVVLKCLKMLVIGVFVTCVFAPGAQAWSPDILPDYRISEVKTRDQYSCPGNFEDIAVSGEGSINACVMGKNARIAFYITVQGGVNYAVSFPSENTFYRLDVCNNVRGCVYAEANDTFVGKTFGYKQFLSNLIKTTQSGVVHYVPSETSHYFSTNKAGSLSLVGSSVAISENGKWILTDMNDYGIFRINTQTLQARRIVAPGFNYANNNGPQLEMVISNDGNTAAIMGVHMGLWVIPINETCGDSFNEFMQQNFVGAVSSCRFIPTSQAPYMFGFTFALSPMFGDNDKSLSFDVYSNSSTPRHVTLFSETRDNSRNTFYVAVGDSYSSGEGEVDDAFYIGGARNRCHLSTRSYPFLLADDWAYAVHSTACSGATIDSARGKGDNSNQTAQLAELEVRSPNIATIGIGGNDIGLIGKLKDCLGLDTCKWAGVPKDRRDTALEIQRLYPRLKSFYKDVKDRTQGTVIVVGYPLIIHPEEECRVPLGILLNGIERRFMNETIHYLNQVVRAAALDTGLEHADVENVFTGGELCSSLISPLMNDIRFGDEYSVITALPSLKIIGSESFHPKPAGHALVANKVHQSYADPTGVNTCMNCVISTPVPVLSAYWDSADYNPVPLRASSFLDKAIVKIGDVFKTVFPPFTFQPSSNVTLELHSEVKNLGTVQSAEDGSLEVTISVTDIQKGVHSVHAIGKSFSGNAIEFYDFLEISDDLQIAVGVEPIDIKTDGINASAIINDSNGTIPLLQPAAAKGGTDINSETNVASNILGVSTVAIPSDLFKTNGVVALYSPTNLERKLGNFQFNWIIAGVLVACVSVASVAIYMFYRRKKHRSLDG